jgi:ribosomal protein L9
MCLPIFAAVGVMMGASSATAAAVGTSAVLSAASGAVSAYGAYNSAQGQKQSLEYQSKVDANNATVGEWQAQDAEKRGQDDAARARRANSQQRGAQRTALAANGLDLNSGSALSLLDDTEYFGAVDQQTVANNTTQEAWALRNRAANFTAASNLHKTGASNISPGFAAGSSMLSSASSVADKWSMYKKAA